MSRVKAHECDRCGVVEKVPVPPNMVNAPRRAPGWTTVRVWWPDSDSGSVLRLCVDCGKGLAVKLRYLPKRPQ